MFMAKINRTKYATLGLLSFQPLSGYDIRKNIEKSINYFWSENYSQIYPTLKTLAKDGLATVSVTESEGKPDRKVYSITPEGLAELRRWLQVPPEPEVRRFELLLKLFFGHQIDSEIIEDYVADYQEQHRTMLNELEEIERLLLTIEDRSLDQTYQLMTVRYGITVAKALIDWCNQSLETFEDMHNNNLKKE